VKRRATHTDSFRRSTHKKEETAIAMTIKAPPIVGVPALSLCPAGPSVRIFSLN